MLFIRQHTEIYDGIEKKKRTSKVHPRTGSQVPERV
jgi:hypothetical protein